MLSLILTLHIVVCVLLVILVLLQAGKEGMGVIFGGGGNSVFGAGGAGSLLTKLTGFMAVLFVITSLSYTILTSTAKDDESSILNIQLEEPVPAPTTTEPAATQPEASATPEAAPEAAQSAEAKEAAPEATPADSAKAEDKAAEEQKK